MTQHQSKNLYDPEQVAELFDRCSAAYRWWSAVASFGMIRLWRIACVKSLPTTTKKDGKFVDLMAGTGEIWPHLIRYYPDLGPVHTNEIIAIDNSKKCTRKP